MNNTIDIQAIAQGLLKDLERDSQRAHWAKVGVELLFSRIQKEAQKQALDEAPVPITELEPDTRQVL